MFKFTDVAKFTAVGQALSLAQKVMYAIAAAAALGLGWYVYDWIGDQRELVVVAKYEKTIKDAKDVADAESLRLQGEVDAANQKAIELQQARAFAELRISALNKRLSNNQPTAESIAKLTATSCGNYAAEVQRDFGECRERYQEMGSIAAGASDAAWTHREAWPRVSRESLDKMRINNREKK